jgi:hypothetical protein
MIFIKLKKFIIVCICWLAFYPDQSAVADGVPAFQNLPQIDSELRADIDLREIYPEIFSKIPIRNQGQNGICYAAAASTMIDFERGIRGIDGAHELIPVSAIESAIQTTLDQDQQGVDGGEICDVIHSISRRGYACSQSSVPQSVFHELGFSVQTELVNRVMLPYIGTGVSMPQLTYEQFEGGKKQNLSPEQKLFKTKIAELIHWTQKELRNKRGVLEELVPKKQELFDLFVRTQQFNTYYLFPANLESMISKKYCAGSTHQLRLPILNCQNTKSGSDSARLVDQELSIKRRPVGVSICANVFNNNNYQGVYGGTVQSSCQRHAVVVVGKKMRAQDAKNYYIIRNSWGGDDAWMREDVFRANVFEVSLVR